MSVIFWDALIDTSKMIPWLFLIYIGIEYFERHLGTQFRMKIKKSGKSGPLLGALFGCVPQCGFSVISTALYTKRVISVGTLMAVYLSTSDEAIPIILSQPEHIKVLMPLIGTKFIIAVTAGYCIDFISQRSAKNIAEVETCATSHQLSKTETQGCCGHTCSDEKYNFSQLIYHPVVHTLKVFIFLLATTLLINYVIFRVGEENLPSIIGNSVFQPIFAALIGLIPNCASSVAITEVFLKGGITFGSAVAGLSAGAGLGTLVLFKENRNYLENIKIIALLFTISSLCGILIQLILG